MLSNEFDKINSRLLLFWSSPDSSEFNKKKRLSNHQIREINENHQHVETARKPLSTNFHPPQTIQENSLSHTAKRILSHQLG